MNVQKKLKRIQTLNIGPEQLAMLALVILGKRPSVEIDLYSGNTGTREFVTLLGSLGMPAYCARLPENANKNQTAIVCVANLSSDATLLQSLVKIRDRTQSMSDPFHIAYGALMGYPLSAIQGFIQKQTLDEKDYPVFMVGHPLLDFKLSKSSWREESRVVQDWERTLKENAPKILDGLISCVA
jgi:hypothetical protein